MSARHIHHALKQVQELQVRILERHRFKGYSGRARALGGTVALFSAFLMSSESYPQTPEAHILGWGAVFLTALLINYGALIWWFLFDLQVNREWRKLKPIVDVFPPLFVAGVLTFVFILKGEYQYLFGIWMCLFALANLASRHVLPQTIWLIGAFYLACGTWCLLDPHISFLNPWPMGFVFFVGEWAGGIFLFFYREPGASFVQFLLKTEKEPSL
jgi:hypothetical protein